MSNKFGYYPCYFAHSFIILLFIMKYCSNEDAWRELYLYESFFYEVILDGFDYVPFLSYNCSLTFLLSKLVYDVRFPSWIVRWAIKNNKGFVLNLLFVRYLDLWGLGKVVRTYGSVKTWNAKKWDFGKIYYIWKNVFSIQEVCKLKNYIMQLLILC